MALRESALENNVRQLAAFAERHGLAFAPHGKTTMSPQLFARQLDAGAWGITVASGQQARVARAFGVERILIANEVLDPATLAWIAAESAAGGAGEILFLVDSDEGIAAASAAALAAGATLPVLVDIGFPGGRTGVRTREEAERIGRRAHGADGLALRGVSSYEGALKTVADVTAYFDGVRDVVGRLRDALPETPIVSAGGSAYFDRVGSELGDDWARDAGVQVVLRSGAYLSHDDGVYVGKTGFNRIPEEGRLAAAVEVWAHVVSAPEPGLAIVAMGKRDAPYDEGLPTPLAVRRPDGSVIAVDGRASVPALDDQHGYVRFDEELALRPGDLVRFGISHPCTAFDKWRALPILDDEDRIVEVVDTWF